MSDPVAHLNGALAGRYRVERELGEGGMATVHLAEDMKHHRQVALKVLKPEIAAAVGAHRFLAEIETTARLQHPHILPLFDSGEAAVEPKRLTAAYPDLTLAKFRAVMAFSAPTLERIVANLRKAGPPE